jgi:alginate O-acetyltransferase complex protein AlgI
MLFNSFTFIALFVPLVLLGYLYLGSWRHLYAESWLVGASLAFYAYWDPRYLPLLLISAGVNFLAGRAISSAKEDRGRRALLTLSIAFNLALLGYFKYANFFVDTLHSISGLDFSLRKVILPLGISFFSFTQIAFLVDTYRGEAREPKFLHYLLFVTYFPHLIAGPILHHKEMMPQFSRPETYKINPRNLVAGSVMFIIGLFKKVVLADGVAAYATPVFDAVAKGFNLVLQDAWMGALAYTYQLYFDFSGYCDMAIGVSLMFGILLPLNFNSPYKSTSITEFWRRWHMTLSRFLRDYLYIPLGGNRKGGVRRYVNLLVTMFLGGLWHGAGWTFVIWGVLHGFYLCINHAFRAAGQQLGLSARHPIGVLAGWLLTFLAVVVAWVFFRANNIDSALRFLGAMLNMSPNNGHVFRTVPAAVAFGWIWLILLTALVLTAPNSQEIMRNYLDGVIGGERPGRLSRMTPAFQITRAWAIAAGAVFAVGLAYLPQPTSFLYFNF